MDPDRILSVICTAFPKVIIYLKSGERLQGVICATNVSEDFTVLTPVKGKDVQIKISEIASVM
jgi:hypothetical protein